MTKITHFTLILNSLGNQNLNFWQINKKYWFFLKYVYLEAFISFVVSILYIQPITQTIDLRLKHYLLDKVIK